MLSGVILVMEIINMFFQRADLFLLVWGRVVGLFLTAIPFNGRNIPVQAKVWLAALVAFFLFMIYTHDQVQVAGNLVGYLLQFLGEVLIGVVLGFLTQITFSVFQFAGQMIDMQMGFGVVNVIDPQSGVQVPVMGTFKYLLAIVFFLTIDGHHYLLAALNQSYNLLPIGQLQLTGPFYAFVIDLAGEMFSAAFKIALPLLGALFIADLALGIIARTVPQINVFLIGMPLKIGLGLGLMLLLVPLLVWVFGRTFTGLFENLSQLLIILGR